MNPFEDKITVMLVQPDEGLPVKQTIAPVGVHDFLCHITEQANSGECGIVGAIIQGKRYWLSELANALADAEQLIADKAQRQANEYRNWSSTLLSTVRPLPGITRK